MWIKEETIRAVLLDTEKKMAQINKEAALAEMDYYISAKKLIEDILEARGIEIETVPKLIRLIKAQPRQEPKRGRWIESTEPSAKPIGEIYVCSNCYNFEAWGETELYNYCPNCGARMEGEQ